jgi:hypothetical protein
MVQNLMAAHAAICHHLPPSATICRHLPPSAAICRHY